MLHGLIGHSAVFACMCAALSAAAGVTLFDFEDANLRFGVTGTDCRVMVTNAFASSGTHSLHFAVAPWTEGHEEWPAVTLTPPVRDWRGYDRLVVDVVNLEEGGGRLSLRLSAPTGRVENGLVRDAALPAFGHVRWIARLSSWTQGDPADIGCVQFLTEKPRHFNIFLDRVMLLRKGEEPPPPRAQLARELAPAAAARLAAFDRELDVLRAETGGLCADADMMAACARRCAALAAAVAPARRALAAGAATLADLDAVRTAADGFDDARAQLLAFLRFWKRTRAADLPTDGMLVGKATAMEQVLPRDAGYDVAPADALAVRLARNEREGVQLLVTPTGGALQGVRVSAGDLRRDGFFSRAKLSATNIACDVVGYAKTGFCGWVPYEIGYAEPTNSPSGRTMRTRPPHVGWWPDTLLDYLGPVDIDVGVIQSFYLRVRCPADQPAGVYRGTVTVTCANASARRIPLVVRVNDFTLGKAAPLPLAITFQPNNWFDHDQDFDDAEAFAAARKSPEFPLNAWRRHRAEWGEFLADYYITMDSIYTFEMPYFDVLERLKAQGRLGLFNLGFWGGYIAGPGAAEDWSAATIPRLRRAYEEARARGLVDKAYIYGCDETSPAIFGRVRPVLDAVRKAFPGVPLATTADDRSYGLDPTNGLPGFDIYTPITPRFDPEQAAKARAAGHQVWWYICCLPPPPYANMLLESPAIEGRLLMGAMTQRMKPDGFLYYQISLWNSTRTLTDGPFTSWRARTCAMFNGDGAWTCCGPDGKPLATLRLENFRDGLDDLAYCRLLEKKLAARPSDGTWSAAARAALAVPVTVMDSMTNFTYRPAEVYRWRDTIADLLER